MQWAESGLSLQQTSMTAFLEERDDALAFHLMLNLERYDLSDHRRSSLSRER